ncbi:DUF2897 family protein [Aestuariibacter salexigens]|nr:DUF2897 family protein [Aestuariibacter salexigens]
MSTGWIVFLVVLAFGIIIGNIMLLKHSNRFSVPKDFKKREYDDDNDR